MNCIGLELLDLKQYGYVWGLSGLPFETDNVWLILWYDWNYYISLMISLYYSPGLKVEQNDQAKLLLHVYHPRSIREQKKKKSSCDPPLLFYVL